MDTEWRRRLVALSAVAALVGLVVASGTPAAAHAGHGSTATPLRWVGDVDLVRVGVALGVGAVAAGLAGVVLWFWNR